MVRRGSGDTRSWSGQSLSRPSLLESECTGEQMEERRGAHAPRALRGDAGVRCPVRLAADGTRPNGAATSGLDCGAITIK